MLPHPDRFPLPLLPQATSRHIPAPCQNSKNNLIHSALRNGNITVDWSPLADFLSDLCSTFQLTDLYINAIKAGGRVLWQGYLVNVISPLREER